MTKAAVSTRDQLRALIHTHAETTVAPKVSMLAPAAPARQIPAALIATAAPADNPVLPRVLARQSLRLLPIEFDKINTIINNTIQRTGSRATVTDVLRVGLARLTEAAHIEIEELKALRATDRRRFAQKGGGV